DLAAVVAELEFHSVPVLPLDVRRHLADGQVTQAERPREATWSTAAWSARWSSPRMSPSDRPTRISALLGPSAPRARPPPVARQAAQAGKTAAIALTARRPPMA